MIIVASDCTAPAFPVNHPSGNDSWWIGRVNPLPIVLVPLFGLGGRLRGVNPPDYYYYYYRGGG